MFVQDSYFFDLASLHILLPPVPAANTNSYPTDLHPSDIPMCNALHLKLPMCFLARNSPSFPRTPTKSAKPVAANYCETNHEANFVPYARRGATPSVPAVHSRRLEPRMKHPMKPWEKWKYLNRLKPACSLKRGLQPQTNYRKQTQGSSCGLFWSWAKQVSTTQPGGVFTMNNMGMIYTIFFKSPPDNELYKVVTPYNDKYILLVGPTAECKSHSSARWIPGKRWQKSIWWSRHAWRFHAGGAKQPNSALNGRYTWKRRWRSLKSTGKTDERQWQSRWNSRKWLRKIRENPWELKQMGLSHIHYTWCTLQCKTTSGFWCHRL